MTKKKKIILITLILSIAIVIIGLLLNPKVTFSGKESCERKNPIQNIDGYTDLKYHTYEYKYGICIEETHYHPAM